MAPCNQSHRISRSANPGFCLESRSSLRDSVCPFWNLDWNLGLESQSSSATQENLSCLIRIVTVSHYISSPSKGAFQKYPRKQNVLSRLYNPSSLKYEAYRICSKQSRKVQQGIGASVDSQESKRARPEATVTHFSKAERPSLPTLSLVSCLLDYSTLQCRWDHHSPQKRRAAASHSCSCNGFPWPTSVTDKCCGTLLWSWDSTGFAGIAFLSQLLDFTVVTWNQQ